MPERFPTIEAQQSLAKRLGHFYSDDMQDWEWEVADPARFEEYVDLYETETLSDDEKFSLMEIILQCIEEAESDATRKAKWIRVVAHLRGNFRLHESTLQYWAMWEADEVDQKFCVSDFVHAVLPKSP